MCITQTGEKEKKTRDENKISGFIQIKFLNLKNFFLKKKL